MVLYHIVLLKLKSDANPTDVASFVFSAKDMVGKVPGLKSIELGAGYAKTLARGKGYDFGLCAVLEKPDDISGYAVHPAHLIVQDLRIKIADDALALDWEAGVF